MTNDQFVQLAMTFPATEEKPHFDRRAFKVAGRRIFATLHEESRTANLKLSVADQAVYCRMALASVYPVGNKWGLQGWTTFDLTQIDHPLLLDALARAHKEAAIKMKP